MISNEAITAAGEAFLSAKITYKGELGGSSVALLAALEAAAPYIQHDAWLEGRNADPDKFVANPYPLPGSMAESTSSEAAAPLTPVSKALAAVLELHREVPCTDEEGDPVPGTCCEECKDLDDHSGERVHEVYPCQTVREITAALKGEPTFTDMRNKIEGMTK